MPEESRARGRHLVGDEEDVVVAQPVFAGHVTEAVAVALPVVLEADGAVLPSLED